MDYKALSNWFWDIAKYVVIAIIISTFLGSFRDNTALLYILSFATVGALIAVAIFFNKLSNKKQLWKQF
jgi:formate hydrogenlyase subunit 4